MHISRQHFPIHHSPNSRPQSFRLTRSSRRPVSWERRSGFTLVELLVVIAIIAILIALLIPAIQMVRASARKAQCANQIRQMATAMTAYETAHKKFPPGFVWPDRTLWQAYLLPHIELNALYQTLEFGQPFDGGGANTAACGTPIALFKCPMAGDLEPIDFEGIDNRQPCTYLVCASGTAVRETGSTPLIGDVDADGCFYNNSETRTNDVRDGLSSTVMLGESLFLIDRVGTDNEGDPQAVDHWYIGSTDNLPAKNGSEALGSTAVPINAHENQSLPIEEVEISFSSNHFSGAQFAFMDMHVEWIADSIDPTIYSAMGTRWGKEVVSDEY